MSHRAEMLRADNDSTAVSSKLGRPPWLPSAGPVQLLVLQATPFCNINCSYCYLTNRASRQRMQIGTVASAVKAVIDSPFVTEGFGIVWHAGEPLTVPRSFYEQAVRAIDSVNCGRYTIRQTIQTNGLLLDAEWLNFLAAHSFRIGISIDGPAHIHDRCRETRGGLGTHKKAMEALQLLSGSSVDFYVIAVLTRYSLDYADEIFAFFKDNGVRSLAFNVEEIEGYNHSSSLATKEAEERFYLFVRRFADLNRESGDCIRIREFERIRVMLRHRQFHDIGAGQQTTPFRIISVDAEGYFSTFSPELLSLKHRCYGDFILGNIESDQLEDVLWSPKLRRLYDEIRCGINECRQTCAYFPICGGGSPSNKLSENGTFVSTETTACRFRDKIMVESFLDHLENDAER